MSTEKKCQVIENTLLDNIEMIYNRLDDIYYL